MRSRLALPTAALLSCAAACTVQPQGYPPLNFGDGGSASDAYTGDGSADAAPILCGGDAMSCPSGMVCVSGTCAPACKGTSDCPANEVCRAGQCVTPKRSCMSNADCPAPDEICLAVHYCGRAIADDGTLAAKCNSNADCGPGGLCDLASRECTGCVQDLDCHGLTCDTFSGMCVEPTTCTANTECFPGNTCSTLQPRACVRSTTGCTAGTNFSVGSAIAIADQYYDNAAPPPTGKGLAICGAAENWFKLELPPEVGARVIVISTPTVSTVTLNVTDKNQMPIDPVDGIILPDITALDIRPNTSTTTETIYLQIVGNDTNGAYALDVRRYGLLCVEDALALYGDKTATTAPVFGYDTIDLRACYRQTDSLRIPVALRDELIISATYGSSLSLDLALLDASGQMIQATGSTTGVTLKAGMLAAGNAALTISNRGDFAAEGVPYTLNVQRILGTRLDACGTPTKIVLDASGRATKIGAFNNDKNLGLPPCLDQAYAFRHDEVFELDPLSSLGLFSVALHQTNKPSTSTVGLAVLTRCVDDNSSVECDESPRPLHDAMVFHTSTTAAPIYLLITSYGRLQEDVQFELDVSYTPLIVPANVNCAAATPITQTSIVPASTFGASNTAYLTGGNCTDAGDATGPNRFWALSLGAHEPAAVELLGPNGGELWISTSCTDLTGTCTTSASIQDGLAAKVMLRPHVATNYVVTVDGVDSTSAGNYSLRVVLPPDLQCFSNADCMGQLRCDDYRCSHVPSNDTCAGATPLTLSGGKATIQGSTGAANDDYFLTAPPGSILPCLQATDTGLPDVTYSVMVPAGINTLTARITAAEWDPALAIYRGQCGVPAAVVACNDDLRFPDLVLPEATVNDPPAGQYFIIVDGAVGSGPFTLEVDAQ
jgi:hypothetical protein